MAGADPTGNGGALAGFADQRNIMLLVEAGFTPAEATRIYTLNAAQYLGDECSAVLRRPRVRRPRWLIAFGLFLAVFTTNDSAVLRTLHSSFLDCRSCLL
jgi:hypothetical protein